MSKPYIEHEAPEKTIQDVARKALHIYGRQVHLAKAVHDLDVEAAELQALGVVLEYLREKAEDDK